MRHGHSSIEIFISMSNGTIEDKRQTYLVCYSFQASQGSGNGRMEISLPEGHRWTFDTVVDVEATIKKYNANIAVSTIMVTNIINLSKL